MATKFEGLLVGGLMLGGLVLLAEAFKPPQRRAPPPTREQELHAFMAGQLQQVASQLRVRAPALRPNPAIVAIHAAGNMIEYNPGWIEAKLAQHCGSEQCVVTIIVGLLGHEMSHILHGDRYGASQYDNHQLELRADRLAGWVLAKLGHIAEDLKKLFAEFEALGSHTHPPAFRRIATIEDGFQRGLRGMPWA